MIFITVLKADSLVRDSYSLKTGDKILSIIDNPNY